MSEENNKLRDVLKNSTFNDAEVSLIKTAIVQLKEGEERERFIYSDLQAGFRSLALKQQLSPDGLKFFTNWVKPDFKRDFQTNLALYIKDFF